MVRTTFSGREIITVLRSFGYVPVPRSGGHVRLRYENTDTGDVRNVDVPMHDEVKIGTLRSIADQCGAEDFQEWCRWIDDHACISVFEGRTEPRTRGRRPRNTSLGNGVRF